MDDGGCVHLCRDLVTHSTTKLQSTIGPVYPALHSRSNAVPPEAGWTEHPAVLYHDVESFDLSRRTMNAGRVEPPADECGCRVRARFGSRPSGHAARDAIRESPVDVELSSVNMLAVKPVLLGLYAHPDDETFANGGTLARYAAAGADVHVIIGTDGIAGSVEDPAHLATHHTLAQIRSAELARAAVILGLTSVWSLPYRDSGMRNTPENDHPQALIRQPVEQLIADILGYMQRLQPDVVVTHDPYGGYGHPDHIRMCQAATAAFYLARAHAGADWRGPRKLYYTALDKNLIKVFVRVAPLFGVDPRRFGRNRDIDAVEISRWRTPVTTRINVAGYRELKLAASRAHASQYGGGPGFLAFLPGFLRRKLTETESFTRVFPAPSTGVEQSLTADLF